MLLYNNPFVGRQPSQQQVWRPTLNKPLTEKYLRFYESEPERFTTQQVQNLAKHSEFYNLPFRKVTEEQAEFNLFRAFRYVGEGFLQGYSTLKIGEQRPVNSWERVAKSVGQAMGYAGWIPSFGFTPLKVAAKAIAGKSVPILISSKITNKIAPTLGKAFGRMVTGIGASTAAGEAGAVAGAAKFLTAQRTTIAGMGKGMMRMGISGAISNWQDGIDAMVGGFFGGAKMEAGDRLIANILGNVMGGAVGGPQGGGWTTQAITRTLLGSMWNGLPSTLRNETTPDQIYDYLIGGFFAYRDMPENDAKALEVFNRNIYSGAIPKDVTDYKGYDGLNDVVKGKLAEMHNKVAFTENERAWTRNYIAEMLTSKGIEVDEETQEALVSDVLWGYKSLDDSKQEIRDRIKETVAEREAAEEEFNKATEEEFNKATQVREVIAPIVIDHDKINNVPLTKDNQINTLRQYNGPQHFGNPFTGTDRGRGTIRMRNIKESVAAYIKWIDDPEAVFVDKYGKEHKNVLPDQRAWILDQIDSGNLDGKTLHYYRNPTMKPYVSHADALAEYAYKRRVAQRVPQDTKPIDTKPIIETPDAELQTRIKGAILGGAEDEYVPQKLFDHIIVSFTDRTGWTPSQDDVELMHVDRMAVVKTLQNIVNGETTIAKQLPEELLLADPWTTALTSVTNTVISDGDSPISTHLVKMAQQSPAIAPLINPDAPTRFNVVAFIPGVEQTEGRAPFSASDSLLKTMDAGSAIITPDQFSREASKTQSEYWKAFESTMRSNGYEDNGTGQWLKPTTDDINVWEAHANVIRANIDDMMIRTNGKEATAGQKITAIVRRRMIYDNEKAFTDKQVKKVTGSFIRLLSKEPSRDQVDKWLDSYSEKLKFSEEERAEFHRVALLKRSNEIGEQYMINVQYRKKTIQWTDKNGVTHEKEELIPEIVDYEKVTGSTSIRGKRPASDVPKSRGIFSTVSWLDHNPLRTINKIHTIKRGVEDLHDGMMHFVEDQNTLKKSGVYKKMVEMMAKEGYFYFGGRGDHPEYNFVELHKDFEAEFGDEDIGLAIAKRMAQAAAVYRRKIDVQEHLKAINLDFDRWIKDSFPYKPVGEELVRLKDIYLKTYANNLLWLREFNKAKDWNFVFNSNFLKGSGDLNKRLQILLTTGINTTTDDVAKVDIRDGETLEDAKARWTNLPYSIIDVGNAISKEGDTELTKAVEDGNGYMLKEDLEAMLKAAGLPWSGGHIKAFIVATDENGGMVLIKPLLKIATPAQEALMREQGIRVLFDDEAVKQLGNREKSKAWFDTKEFVWKDTDVMPKYSIDVESFKIVMSEQSTIDSVGKLNKITKQMVTNLNWSQGQRSDFISTLYNRARDGSDEANKFAEGLLTKSPEQITQADIQKLMDDLDDIGLVQIANLVQSGNLKIIKAMITEIANLNRHYADLDKVEGTKEFEEEADLNTDGSHVGGIEAIMRLKSDVAIADKHVISFVENALNKYVINRASRPTIGNSIFKAKNRGWLLSEYRLKRDEFMLGNNYRHKLINFYGNEITLGALWDNYVRSAEEVSGWDLAQNSEHAQFIDRAREFFNNIAVQRVPQDNPAGMQVLLFKGFMDVDSNDILMHPYSKEVTGGSDDDGDSYYVWFGGRDENGDGYGMKMSWLKRFKKDRDMWLPLYKQGKTIKNSVDNNGVPIGDYLFGEKSEDAALSDWMNERALLGAPGILQQSSTATVYARNLLSDAVSYTTLLRQAYYELSDSQIANTIPWRMVEIKTRNKDGTEVYYQFIIRPRAEDSAEVQMATTKTAVLITRVADPSEFAATPNIDNAKASIFMDLFNVKLVSSGKLVPISKGSDAYELIKQVSDKFVSPFRSISKAINSSKNYLSAKLGVSQFPNWGKGSTYFGGIYKNLIDLDWGFDAYSVYKSSMRFVINSLHDQIPWRKLKGKSIKVDEFALMWTPKNNDGILDHIAETDIPIRAWKPLGLAANGKHSYKIKKNFINKFRNKDTNDKIANLYEYFLGKSKFSSIRKDEISAYGKLDNQELIDMTILLEKAGFIRKRNSNEIDNDLLYAMKIKSEMAPENTSDLEYFGMQRARTISLIQQDLADMKTLIAVNGVLERYKISNDSASIATINKIWQRANEFKNSVARGRDAQGNLFDAPKSSIEVADANARIYRTHELKNQFERDIFDIFMLGSWQMKAASDFHRHKVVDAEGKQVIENGKPKWAEEDDTDAKYIARLQKEADATNYSQLGLIFSAVSNASKNYFYNIDKNWWADMPKEVEAELPKDAEISDLTNPVESMTQPNPTPAPKTLEDYVTKAKKYKAKVEALIKKESELEKSLELISRESFERKVEVNKMIRSQQKLMGRKLTKKEEAEVRDEIKTLFGDIKTYMEYYGWPKRTDIPLEGLIRSMFGKTITQMSILDWKAFRNWFKDIRKPKFFERLFGVKEGDPVKLQWLDYYRFPETIDKRLMRNNIYGDMEKVVYYNEKGEWTEGYGFRPTAAIGSLQRISGALADENERNKQTILRMFSDALRPYMLPFGKDADTIWYMEALLRDAHSNRDLAEYYLSKGDLELSNGFYNDFDLSVKKVREYYREHSDVLNKQYTIDTGKKKTTMSGHKVRVEIGKVMTDFNRRMMLLQKGEVDENGKHVVLEQYRLKPSDVFKPILNRFKYFQDIDKLFSKFDFFDTKAFSNDVMLSLYSGKGVPQGIGIDGSYKIQTSGSLQNQIFEAAKQANDDLEFARLVRDIIKKQRFKKEHWTGVLPYEHYFPRFKEDPVQAKARYKARLQDIVDEFNPIETRLAELEEIRRNILLTPHAKDKDGNPIGDPDINEDFNLLTIEDQKRYQVADAEYSEKIEQKFALVHEYRELVERMRSGYKIYDDSVDLQRADRLQELYLQQLREREEKSRNQINAAIKYELSGFEVESQKARKSGAGEYDFSRATYEEYMENIINAYYKNITWSTGKNRILDAERNNEFGDATPQWVNFLKLYLNDNLGNPNVITEDLINDPGMRLKNNPYLWVSDSFISKFLYKIGKSLNLIKEEGDVPEELQRTSFQLLNNISQIEAKYEMASLLAHTKSMVANVFGGTQMTMISTGLGNLKKARNIEWLRKNINVNWNNFADVERDVITTGMMEEYMLAEAGMGSKSLHGNFQKFFDEAVLLINKNPDMADTTLMEIAKKHSIGEAMFQKAAWFMRRAERTLRRDAFLAHYVYNYERFGGAMQGTSNENGFQFHPILMKMAKDGVKMTQFLYTAPYRPAIARSAFGKILTRFQLWTWNSLKTRNEIIGAAKMYGWTEGTPEMERFSRFIAMDLVSLALSQAFLFSVFDSALPPPWNWFTDVANWLFGSEEEKKTAFFGAYPWGVAPLQIVTPPVARMFPAMVTGLISGNWDRVTDYTVWTMFPFGRMARDVHKSYLNPKSFIDRMTGIPFSRMEGFGKNEETD